MTEVFINGKFIGNVDNGSNFVKSVIEERRKGVVDSNLNVYYDDNNDEIYLESNRGRVRRPLIVVKNSKPLLTEKHIMQVEKNEIAWHDLIEKGIIEYLDAAEEENSLIAFNEEELTNEHTHLEISPLSMLGLITSLVPFSNFNQSTRLNAGSKNQKQAVGFYVNNFTIRMDMDVNLQFTPQIPIVKSIMHDISEYEKHPAGQNLVVAVMSFEGYNIEDAIILNKGSIDRGMGRSCYYRPSIAEELRYSGGLVDEVSIPEKDVKGYRSEKDYRHLEDDGIIYAGAKVGEGDVIIGKTSPPRFLSSLDEYSLASTVRRESSVAISQLEINSQAGMVKKVLLV